MVAVTITSPSPTAHYSLSITQSIRKLELNFHDYADSLRSSINTTTPSARKPAEAQIDFLRHLKLELSLLKPATSPPIGTGQEDCTQYD
jgi:hypothetical protein